MRFCAYCLMSNHWHFVVWPERDGDLPAFMQQMTNTHAKRWKEYRREIGYLIPGKQYYTVNGRKCNYLFHPKRMFHFFPCNV